ncbi:hypothetical protein D3C77_536340 [compost metagenome]
MLAALTQQAKLFDVTQGKALEQEIRLAPRAIKLADIHAQLQLADRQLPPGGHMDGIAMPALVLEKLHLTTPGSPASHP